jgi:hypothetical protein
MIFPTRRNSRESFSAAPPIRDLQNWKYTEGSKLRVVKSTLQRLSSTTLMRSARRAEKTRLIDMQAVGEDPGTWPRAERILPAYRSPDSIKRGGTPVSGSGIGARQFKKDDAGSRVLIQIRNPAEPELAGTAERAGVA